VISDDALVYFHAHAGEAPELGLPAPIADTNQVTPDAWPPRLGPAHVAQFADFVEAIRADRHVRVGTADGRVALAVVLGLYGSAASGRPVPIRPAVTAP
jgi:predicted dehydrogenase